MYKYDDRVFFDRASGRRATDKYHVVAQNYFERIKEQEKTEGGLSRIAAEGYELAEDTRRKVAEVLHCKPRNVFFANSATMAAIPIMLAFLSFKKEEIDFLLKKARIHSSDPSIVRLSEPFLLRPEGAYQYPSVLSGVCNADYRFRSGRRALNSILTNQNIGYRISPNESQILDFFCYFSRRGSTSAPAGNEFITSCDFFSKPNYTDSAIHAQKKYLHAKNDRMVVVLETVDRLLWQAYSQKSLEFLKTNSFESANISLKNNRKLKPPFVFLDGSHSFGVLDHTVPLICDAFIAGSSKGVGAEPTIGIAYVSDEVLSIMERVLNDIDYQRIAFQFSPESRLGVKNEEVLSSRYWISLPELASFNVALGDLLVEGIEKRTNKLLEIRTELLRRLQLLCFEEGLSSKLLRSGGDIHDKPLFDRSLAFRLHDKFGPAAFLNLPHCVGVISTFNADRIRYAINYDGYIVGEPQILNFTPDAEKGKPISYISPKSIRISFRHDIEQSIDGLCNSIERALWPENGDIFRKTAEDFLNRYPHLVNAMGKPLNEIKDCDSADFITFLKFLHNNDLDHDLLLAAFEQVAKERRK